MTSPLAQGSKEAAHCRLAWCRLCRQEPQRSAPLSTAPLVLPRALDPARKPAAGSAPPCPPLSQPSKAAAGAPCLTLAHSCPGRPKHASLLGALAPWGACSCGVAALREASRTRMQRRPACSCGCACASYTTNVEVAAVGSWRAGLGWGSQDANAQTGRPWLGGHNCEPRKMGCWRWRVRHVLCCAVLCPAPAVSELGNRIYSGPAATCHCLLPSRRPAASGPWPTRHRSHQLTPGARRWAWPDSPCSVRQWCHGRGMAKNGTLCRSVICRRHSPGPHHADSSCA